MLGVWAFDAGWCVVTDSLVEQAARAIWESGRTPEYYTELGRGRRVREPGEPTLSEIQARAVLTVVESLIRADERERVLALIERFPLNICGDGSPMPREWAVQVEDFRAALLVAVRGERVEKEAQ